MMYKVIFKGTADRSINGWNNFLSHVAYSYSITTDQAKSWIADNGGVLVQTANQGEAEAVAQRMRSLGGLVEVTADGAGPQQPAASVWPAPIRTATIWPTPGGPATA